MATKTPMFDDDNDGDVPELPKEFDGDASDSGSNLNLEDMGFNDDRDEKEYLKLNPPTGDWFKDDSWQMQKKVYNEDSQPGDVDPSGRTFFVFAGKPVARQANGLEYQPMFFLRISPDKRYKQDKPGEVDTAFKLYLKAKELYLTLHSEKVRNMKQLVTMLEEDNYVIRSMNGDNGPIVVDVKAKRQAK